MPVIRKVALQRHRAIDLLLLPSEPDIDLGFDITRDLFRQGKGLDRLIAKESRTYVATSSNRNRNT